MPLSATSVSAPSLTGPWNFARMSAADHVTPSLNRSVFSAFPSDAVAEDVDRRMTVADPAKVNVAI